MTAPDRMRARMQRERAERLLRRLERAAVALLLVAGLVPRARDLGAGFDREAEGFQGAFFALAAVNYERLGVGALLGYPVLNVEEEHDPAHWYGYANHPPTVALLGWASLWAAAPAGWSEAWRAHEPPRGVEPALRAPFLALHLGALLAFWWALREGLGSRTALIGLALLASSPVLVHYGMLVNYENPSLLAMALAAGFYARAWRRERWALPGVGLAFALGACFTYAPLFLLPPLALHAWGGRRNRLALAVLGVGAAGAVGPLAAHAWLSARALARTGQAPDGVLGRARHLLEPLLDGSYPIGEWAALQVERAADWITWPVPAVAAVGGATRLARRLVPSFDAWLLRRDPEPPKAGECDVATPLLLAGLLYLLAFYRHTLEPQHPFLMLVAPGVAAWAALGLSTWGAPLVRLGGGFAPLVLLTSLLVLPGVAAANRLRFEHRAPLGAVPPPGAAAPVLPLPRDLGAELAAVVPPGALGMYPEALGLNLAATYYAWRTLWPVADLAPGQADAVADRFGLADAERWLALPNEPPPAAAPQVAALRPLAEAAVLDRSSAPGWLGLRLR